MWILNTRTQNCHNFDKNFHTNQNYFEKHCAFPNKTKIWGHRPQNYLNSNWDKLKANYKFV